MFFFHIFSRVKRGANRRIGQMRAHLTHPDAPYSLNLLFLPSQAAEIDASMMFRCRTYYSCYYTPTYNTHVYLLPIRIRSTSRVSIYADT